MECGAALFLSHPWELSGSAQVNWAALQEVVHIQATGATGSFRLGRSHQISGKRGGPFRDNCLGLFKWVEFVFATHPLSLPSPSIPLYSTSGRLSIPAPPCPARCRHHYASLIVGHYARPLSLPASLSNFARVLTLISWP